MLSKEKIRIENARLYPPAIVDQIQTALSNGAELHADESRRNFYDLDFDGRTYFIYVSPLSGNVTLIATWVQKHPSADEKPDGQGQLVGAAGAAALGVGHELIPTEAILTRQTGRIQELARRFLTAVDNGRA